MAYNNSDVRVLGDMELSGALSFEKNYADFPASPKPRTIVVKGGVTYIYTELVDGSGFWSWQPIGVKQTSYLHTQGSASTTWTVNHGFNSSDFAYFVYDSNHNMMLANIAIIDSNTATITLSSAMTGTAVFFSIEYVNTQNLRASTSATIGTVTLTAPAGVLLVDGVSLAPDLTSYAKFTVTNSWSKAQRGAVVALTAGSTVTPDFSASNNFSLAPVQSFTLANPTNLAAGQSGIIAITQDATGGRVISWGTYFKAAGGTKPVLSTAANAVDYVTYYVESATRVFVSIVSDVK